MNQILINDALHWGRKAFDELEREINNITIDDDELLSIFKLILQNINNNYYNIEDCLKKILSTKQPENLQIVYINPPNNKKREIMVNVTFDFVNEKQKDNVSSNVLLHIYNQNDYKNINILALYYALTDYLIRRGIAICLQKNPNHNEFSQAIIKSAKQGYSEINLENKKDPNIESSNKGKQI